MVVLTITRSPRDVHDFYEKGGTVGAVVGPPSYDQERWGDSRVEAQGGAVEKQQRPRINNWHTKANPPGPGAYSLRRSVSDPTVVRSGKNDPVWSGASPFRSRTGRISKDNLKEPQLVPGSFGFLPCSVKDNPGPGTYDTLGDLAAPDGPGGGQKQIPKVGSNTPASFPALRQPDSMRHTGIGEVEATWHGSNKDTPSPGSFEHSTNSAMHNVMRHTGAAADFHASALERKLYPPECHIEHIRIAAVNPGPGTYNTRKKLARGTSQPFTSGTPQCCSAQPYETTSQSPKLTPGPGGYSPTAEMDLVTKEGTGKEKQAFSGLRSTSNREGWYRPALEQPFTNPDVYVGFIPGPGHYPEPATSMKGYMRARRARTSSRCMQQSFHGVHQPQQIMSLRDTEAGRTTGFSSTESRYCMVPKKTEKVAEPATYDRDYSLGQSVKANTREPLRVGNKGVFGSSKSGERFYRFALDGKKGVPAPHDYEHATPPSMLISIDGSGGAFRSGVPVCGPDHRVDQAARPGPGEYEADMHMGGPVPTNPWHGLSLSGAEPSSPSAKSKSFRKPKTTHLSFGSCQHRSTLGGKPKPTNATPGPGEYDPAAARKKGSGGAAKVTTDRQMEPPEERVLLLATTSRKEPHVPPGPGHYQIAGDLAGRTFNTSGERAASLLMQNASKILEKSLSPRLALQQVPAGGGAGGGLAATRARLGDESPQQRKLAPQAPPEQLRQQQLQHPQQQSEQQTSSNVSPEQSQQQGEQSQQSEQQSEQQSNVYDNLEQQQKLPQQQEQQEGQEPEQEQQGEGEEEEPKEEEQEQEDAEQPEPGEGETE